MINPRAAAAVQTACIAYPSYAHIFLAALAVGMLEPTHELMQSGHVQLYDAHLAELVARLLDGSTLSLPTATELLLVCAEMSLRAPLNRGGYACYCALMAEVFAGHPLLIELEQPIARGDREDGADLRRQLTGAMQRRIVQGRTRGKAALAALRASTGGPANDRRKVRPKAVATLLDVEDTYA